MNPLLIETAELIKKSKKTIALTGAGASTESGIPDFRSKNGLWSRYDPYEYGTLGAFKSNPEKVWQMLAELLDVVNAKPNAGHSAMAELEKAGFLHGIITQNIDGLHEKAGNTDVVEFHGSVDTFICLNCPSDYSLDKILELTLPPKCEACQSILKPNIVFFDEQIPVDTVCKTKELMTGADLLIVAGTSCQVAPASMIPITAYQAGATIIEINLQPVLQNITTLSITGSFSETLSLIIELIMP